MQFTLRSRNIEMPVEKLCSACLEGFGILRRCSKLDKNGLGNDRRDWHIIERKSCDTRDISLPTLSTFETLPKIIVECRRHHDDNYHCEVPAFSKKPTRKRDTAANKRSL